VEQVELELVISACRDQRGDGVVAIRTRKEAGMEAVEVGVRPPQQLERRAGGMSPVDEVVAVVRREGEEDPDPMLTEGRRRSSTVKTISGGQGEVHVGAVHEQDGRGCGGCWRENDTSMVLSFLVLSLAMVLLLWRPTTATVLRMTQSGRRSIPDDGGAGSSGDGRDGGAGCSAGAANWRLETILGDLRRLGISSTFNG
jgi:hypothetical protein